MNLKTNKFKIGDRVQVISAYICADKQQIAVTYTASNDVHEGIFKPVEFVQLVESKIKQNVKDILEQYI